MKARDLRPPHIGQAFKLHKTYPPGQTITGGLSDYEHRTTPHGHKLNTIIWLNGVQLKLTPDTPLTFINKATT
jgi:hypothetical protein